MSYEGESAASADTSRAVAEGFAAALAAQKEGEARERQVQEAVQQRMAALEWAKARASERQERTSRPVRESVGAYCAAAQKEMRERLRRDVRAPVTINYLERYVALTQMQDRSEVLRRIEQTIDLADEAIQAAPRVDAPAALREAAAGYRARLLRLDGIVAGPAALPKEGDEGSELSDMAGFEQGQHHGRIDLAKTAEDAFIAAMGELPADQARLIAQHKEAAEYRAALAEQLDAVGAQVDQVVRAARHLSARQTSGVVLDLGDLPEFSGQVDVKIRRDTAELAELVGLVRASFKTFSQVVCDNGLFAAFAAEGSYGACSGYRDYYWWDDGEEGDAYYCGPVPGREETPKDIPTAVEEPKGGDSLEQCLERMRAFTKRRYWGMLDDDFRQHVDAFWYGFKKLMRFTNTLFRVADKPFRTYCQSLTDQVTGTILDFTSGMDDSQAEAFCKEVKKRGKAGGK